MAFYMIYQCRDNIHLIIVYSQGFLQIFMLTLRVHLNRPLYKLVFLSIICNQIMNILVMRDDKIEYFVLFC